MKMLEEKAKAQAAKPPKPEPELYGLAAYHRRDQLVAEYLKGTVLDARQLAETNLLLFNEYLFLELADLESRPIAESFARQDAQREEQHKKFSQSTIARRR